MAADPRGFIPASDAANGIVTDLALHLECTDIERNILIQSSNGFISTTINNTLMTSNAFFASLPITASTSTTVTIPGLAAEVAANPLSPSLLGFPITFSSTNLLLSPLVTQTTYYLVPTSTTDVYELATSKQNAFQQPAVIMNLSVTPAVVTGTALITSKTIGTVSVMNAIGLPGTLVIDGTSVTVSSTDMLSDIVAAINAAAIPNVTAGISYTYTYSNNNNVNNQGNNCNNVNNNYNNNYNFDDDYNNGNPDLNYSHHSHAGGNNSNTTIATQKLVLADSTHAAIVIGAGSTPALLAALGLSAGTFGEIGAAGNLIIDGHTVVVLTTDTLTTLVANINAATIPNVSAALSANNNALVITDSTGAAITITGTAGVLTSLGITAGTQAASVVSGIPSTQSELFYSAWKNIYFFPEQQIYANLMQDVIKYFQSVGYNIIQQQQVDSSGNPIQAMQWYITW